MADKVPVKLGGTDYTQAFIAIFVIVISLVIFLLYKRKRSRQEILITGICDSGKSLIFSQLIHGKHVQTYTSSKENIANYPCNGEILRIIDIPGHQSLRDTFFEQYKDSARGIVFVVDSNTIIRDIRDVAEFFYNIVVDPVIVKNNPSILLLCNKQDYTFAKGGSAIQAILEKELNTLRFTKANQLESVDPKVKKAALLGNPEEDFTFQGLSLNVDIVESYAYHRNGDVDIDGLKEWLSQQVY